MEHNQYAVWKVCIAHMEQQFVDEGAPSFNRRQVDDLQVVKELTLVAPGGNLGLQLLSVHLNERYSVSPFIPGTAVRWKYLDTPEPERIDAVIRYDDAYRGRM